MVLEYNCMFQTGNDIIVVYYSKDDLIFIHPETEETFKRIEEDFSYN